MRRICRTHKNKAFSPTCQRPSKPLLLSSTGKRSEPDQIPWYTNQVEILAYFHRWHKPLDILGASERLQFVKHRPIIHDQFLINQDES